MTTTYDPFPPGGRRRAEPGHWTEDPRWTGGPGPAPVRADPPTRAEPPLPMRADPSVRAGRSWFRAAVIGLVGALVLAAGWQAYRIEDMSRHNRTLVADLGAERDRTDELAKRLAGVFDPEAVSATVLPSVFRVRAGDLTGTAFSVGPGRRLLTNYHVVADVVAGGGRAVTLERGNTRIEATVLRFDKRKDLALLSAGRDIPALRTATAPVRPGQPVVVVGAPLGLDDSVTSGVISAYRPGDPDGTAIQFDAAINPGNSGGPLIGADRRVVGVATAKARDAEGIGLAIPIRTACETFAIC
jgi:putative serine protease PepD